MGWRGAGWGRAGGGGRKRGERGSACLTLSPTSATTLASEHRGRVHQPPRITISLSFDIGISVRFALLSLLASMRPVRYLTTFYFEESPTPTCLHSHTRSSVTPCCGCLERSPNCVEGQPKHQIDLCGSQQWAWRV
ncbi:hypothetical protein BC936DRAFT_142782 [Jimgerdemannia flammicorona]|uniref:Uncharacterized protein n=1 Tax=Jimgerdemannia flammicorona TaxID=994334 RepID=A0A432ZZW8_9FUNG|nr:hypothetical protein BC936DRAFT_142782 [Jimgerdemannia flammicorona]